MYGPEDVKELPAIKPEAQQDSNLTTPVNAALESGAWTQSIIWGPKVPFRDFTQLELHEDDVVPEEKPGMHSYSTITLCLTCFSRICSPEKATTYGHPSQGQIQLVQRPVLRSFERRWAPSRPANLWAARRRTCVSRTEVAATLCKCLCRGTGSFG